MEIKKIKLSKTARLEISYKKQESDGSSSEVNEKHNSKAHQDFVDAMAGLRVHLQLLSGYAKPADVKDPALWGKEVDDFHVSGYSVGGEDEDQGIVITGYRIVPASKKAQILNCPFTRFNESEETRYKHMDHLISMIENVRDEAIKYLGGKFAVDPQQTLPLTFDTEEHLK
jgi:hypothetical protein